MKVAITKNSWLKESDLRLDSSFHLSQSIQIKHLFQKSPYTLSTIRNQSEKIFSGNIFKRTYVNNPQSGIPYITGSDMIKQDIDSGKYISKRQAWSLNNLILKKGWILVSCSGTLGNTVFTNELFENKIATHDLIRIVPNDKDVIRGFLYAYLSSKYGYNLLTQSSYGGVVKHIEPEHIEEIPVPIFPENKQLEIHKLIIESAELRVEANSLLNNAIELFESSIGRTTVTISNQTDTIRFTKIKRFLSRFDGQYQIITKKLDEERTTAYPYIKIEHLAKKIFVGNRGKRNYVESGLPFLSSSDMMLFNPKRYAKQISSRTPNIENLLVNFNDILISRSGTVGNVVLVGDNLKNCTVSEHALRLVIDENKIAPQYVFCYLKTKQGKTYMEASAFGSVIITLNEELIGNIEIPIINDGHKDSIVKLINDYQKKMDASTLKENQAIQLVENEIEQWQH
jgi:restriction endonuclease S subunit